MKRFEVYRPNPPPEYFDKGCANQAEAIQCEGIIFDDGTCAVRWLTLYKSFELWQTYDDFYKVHGHPEYGTIIKWIDTE